MAREPRRDGRIVTLLRVPRADALVIHSLLAAHGVESIVGGGDADGWYPQLGYADGTPVLVFDDDLGNAWEVLQRAPEIPSELRE